MNKVYFIGNLTKDPDFTTSNNGFSICKFSIAVQRRFKQEGKPDVDFFNIVTFKGIADICAKYLKKGSKVAVTGSIQNDTYDGNDGTKKYKTEVNADEVEFLTPKSETESKPKTEAQVKQETFVKFEPIPDSILPF